VTAEWGATETGRKARIYRLTAAGRRRLAVETTNFARMIHAIRLVLGEV
jgi:DNA-binding PadR family transcriptional regulator